MEVAEDKAQRAVRFDQVAVGEWFKETPDGTWHLKTSSTKGTYQSWGTRYEPVYRLDETVYIGG